MGMGLPRFWKEDRAGGVYEQQNTGKQLACVKSIWIFIARFFVAEFVEPYRLRGPPYALHFKKKRNGGQKDARMDTNPD